MSRSGNARCIGDVLRGGGGGWRVGGRKGQCEGRGLIETVGRRAPFRINGAKTSNITAQCVSMRYGREAVVSLVNL
jgi:hypothetical protein